MKIRRLVGIFEIEQIKEIQSTTSYEYIDEIESVDGLPGQKLYRVVLSDTYLEGNLRDEYKKIFG